VRAQPFHNAALQRGVLCGEDKGEAWDTRWGLVECALHGSAQMFQAVGVDVFLLSTRTAKTRDNRHPKESACR
jgi:hypothetical protein